MLYWLAIQSGMKVTERHRHGLDLFPDHGRTVPFACGATVFYNQCDLRFENPLTCAVRVSLEIEDGRLIGAFSAKSDPGYRFEIEERDHRFWKVGDKTMRENRIMRRVTRSDGTLVLEEELAYNRAQVLYDLVDEEPL
jgi:vancomycin resistance protein VanW